jgi:peroxiredoxin (alkyl hydroperoxide reductase subunit C)
VSTPEGWRHGDAVIEPAPITVDALNDQDPSGNRLDWYYRLRKL